MENTYSKGRTTIAPDVLLTTVRLTTLSVDGVSRMAEEIRNFDKKKSKRMEPYGNEHKRKSMKAYSGT